MCIVKDLTEEENKQISQKMKEMLFILGKIANKRTEKTNDPAPFFLVYNMLLVQSIRWLAEEGINCQKYIAENLGKHKGEDNGQRKDN